MSDERYVLIQDNDCHWYVVPFDMLPDWLTWLDIPDDDERAWSSPEFAHAVGGCTSLVTFTNPVIR